MKDEKRSTTEKVYKDIDLLGESTDNISSLTQKLGSISLNAATEAARSQLHSENFTLVADQLELQVAYLETFSEKMDGLQESIKVSFQKSVGARIADLAHLISLRWRDRIGTIKNSFFETIANGDYKDITADNFKAFSGQLFENLNVIKTSHLFIDGVKKSELGDRNWSEVSLSARQMKLPVGSFSLIFPNQSQAVADCIWALYRVRADAHIVLECAFDDPDIARIIEKGLISCVAISDSSGNSLLINDSNRWTENLSWVRPFQEMTAGRTGYSLEYSKNGWASTMGFYPLGGGKSGFAVTAWLCQEERHKGALLYEHNSGKKFHFPEKNREFGGIISQLTRVADDLRVITNETGMLSVNAAIQAGMAGSEGKSFSVIADQIGRISQAIDTYSAKYESVLESLVKYTVDLNHEFVDEVASYLSQSLIEEITEKFVKCQSDFWMSKFIRATQSGCKEFLFLKMNRLKLRINPN